MNIYQFEGLSTIRAMRATQRFKRDNEDNVDANLKAQFASQAAARWLGLRLQFIGVAMVAGVSFIAVIQHQFDEADPGWGFGLDKRNLEIFLYNLQVLLVLLCRMLYPSLLL